MEIMTKKVLTTKNLTMIAMFSAISAVLMVFEIQLPFSPSFVKFDFSDLPVMLGGFFNRTICWRDHCFYENFITFFIEWNNILFCR